MRRRPLTGRADLLLALASGDAVMADIAGRLGYERRELLPELQRVEVAEQEETADVVTTEVALGPRPAVPWWRAQEFYSRKVVPLPLPDEEARASEITLDPFDPLATVPEFFTRLRQVADLTRPGNRIDLNRVVYELSRGRQLVEFPRLNRRSWGQDLHVVIDLARRLVPYRQDQKLIGRAMKRLLPKGGSTVCVLREGAETPVIEWPEHQRGHELQLHPGATLLVLSDLGSMQDSNSSAAEDRWTRIGRRLKRQECAALALVPCRPDAVPDRLARLWTLIPWEGDSRRRPKPADATTVEACERILTLLSAAVRIEPRLLRAVRKLLAAGRRDPGLESRIWQLCRGTTHCSGAALSQQQAVELRGTLLQDDLKQRAWSLIDAAHRDEYSGVACLEVLRLGKDAGKLGAGGGLARSRRWFQSLGTGETEYGGDFFLKAVSQLTPEAWEASPELHALWKQFCPDAGAASGYDPALAGVKDAPLQVVRVSLIGGRLEYRRRGEAAERSTPLATVRLKNPQIVVDEFDDWPVGDDEPAAFWADGNVPAWADRWGCDDVGPWVEFVIEGRKEPTPASIAKGLAEAGALLYGSHLDPRSGAQLDVFEDSRELVPYEEMVNLEGRFNDVGIRHNITEFPMWVFADGTRLAGVQSLESLADHIGPVLVRQRMRWIWPGSFLMGSAEKAELEGWPETPQQLVTISRAFWMFDTPCTQELWQAVMGENPSGFKGDHRPVEKVSWEDCQGFLSRINERCPGLELTLPTEAEWEYGCRAGTDTPIYAGDSPLDEIAWYDKNAGSETHNVAELLPNAWGLYDTLGNVWEWCRDFGGRPYSSEAVSDPAQLTDSESANRVIRGGSWAISALYVRAACRFGFRPGYRYLNLGFRCSSSGSEPSTGGRRPQLARSQRAVRGRRPIAEPAGDSEPASEDRGVRISAGDAEYSPVPQGPVVRIRTDLEDVFLCQTPRPKWARRTGRDQYGLWAEFTVPQEQAEDVTQRMRWIPPGRFLMGSPESEPGRYGDEGPQHEAVVRGGFWLFDTPCTQALWEAVMGENPSEFKGKNRPVETVSWDDCQEFIPKLSDAVRGLQLRLPSETQWEYACRASTEAATYLGGFDPDDEATQDDLKRIAWYTRNAGSETHDVAELTENPWGLYDMLGNVWEWCQDTWRGDYDQRHPDDEPSANRVIRGGCWAYSARGVRAAYRLGSPPGSRDHGLGFRCSSSGSEPGA